MLFLAGLGSRVTGFRLGWGVVCLGFGVVCFFVFVVFLLCVGVG